MIPTVVIAVDCRPLIDKRISGVSSYTKNMIEALSKLDAVSLVLFYQNGQKSEHLHEYYPKIKWIKKSSMFFHLRSWVKREKLPKNYFEKKPDLIWIPDRRPFYKTCIPVVMTIHDMVPKLYPNTLSLKSRLWHKLFSTKKLIEQVNGVLTPSFTVEQELPRSVPRRVTYEGAVLKGKGELPKGCPKKYSLFLSPSDPRKRPEWLIRLAKEFPKDAFVWAGLKEKDPRFSKKKLKLTPNIHCYGEITENEKIGLMRQAQCLFALSRYEGFDLPVLEALRLKCPVILSDISVHRELYKGLNFVANFEDLRSEYLRSRHQKLNLAKARGDYTWDNAAKMSLLFFRRIIQDKNR